MNKHGLLTTFSSPGSTFGLQKWGWKPYFCETSDLLKTMLFLKEKHAFWRLRPLQIEKKRIQKTWKLMKNATRKNMKQKHQKRASRRAPHWLPGLRVSVELGVFYVHIFQTFLKPNFERLKSLSVTMKTYRKTQVFHTFEPWRVRNHDKS